MAEMEHPSQSYFQAADYVIFVLMFLISIFIGIYFSIKSRHRNTTDEYLMGSHNLGLLPVTISLCVSIISTNTLLGVPAEMYYQGIMYAFVIIPFMVTALVSAIWIVPLLYPLKLTSAHKYLRMRFGSKAVQATGTVLLLVGQILYIGCVIFGPATALETVTDIPAWASIILVGVIGTTYTAFGGMKAVIWTDVFQSAIMLVGITSILVQGSILLGGFPNIWMINSDKGRLKINTGTSITDRGNMLSIVVGYSVFLIAMYGVNQPSVQRYNAMKSMTKAQLVVALNAPPAIVLTILSVMSGMVAFAYYDQKGCDPLAAGYITNANQIIPYFVMEVLPYPGVPGLYVSCLFSGSLSTFSSSINSMSAVFWEDVLLEHLYHLSESSKTRITKALSVIFGVLCMGVAFTVMFIGGNLVQVSFSFFAVALGPLLAVFVLGGLIPWANWLGTLVAVILGMTLNLVLLMGQTLNKSNMEILPTRTDSCYQRGTSNESVNFSAVWTTTTMHLPYNATDYIHTKDDPTNVKDIPWVYQISYVWNSVIGFCLVMIIGMLLSACTIFLNKKHKYSRNLLFRGVKDLYPAEDSDFETKIPLKRDHKEELGWETSL